MTSTAVAKATIPATIERYKPLIAQALPKHLDPDRFARLALTTLRKAPKLQATNPESFVGALLTASALGLEPDVNGEAYLVPYGKECQLIVGYQGLAKMFWQNPLAARLSAEYVCERDEFDFDKGLTPRLHHRPGDRGPVIAYYAIVGLSNGATWFDVFTPAQIKALRKKSGASGDIADPEHWMERKTALKQVLKLAPKSTSLQQTLAVDEKVGSLRAVEAIVAEAVPDEPFVDTVDAEVVDSETGEVLS